MKEKSPSGKGDFAWFYLMFGRLTAYSTCSDVLGKENPGFGSNLS